MEEEEGTPRGRGKCEEREEVETTEEGLTECARWRRALVDIERWGGPKGTGTAIGVVAVANVTREEEEERGKGEEKEALEASDVGEGEVEAVEVRGVVCGCEALE